MSPTSLRGGATPPVDGHRRWRTVSSGEKSWLPLGSFRVRQWGGIWPPLGRISCPLTIAVHKEPAALLSSLLQLSVAPIDSLRDDSSNLPLLGRPAPDLSIRSLHKNCLTTQPYESGACPRTNRRNTTIDLQRCRRKTTPDGGIPRTFCRTSSAPTAHPDNVCGSRGRRLARPTRPSSSLRTDLSPQTVEVKLSLSAHHSAKRYGVRASSEATTPPSTRRSVPVINEA